MEPLSIKIDQSQLEGPRREVLDGRDPQVDQGGQPLQLILPQSEHAMAGKY